MGQFDDVMRPRVAKTVMWAVAKDWFLAKLNRELTAFERRHPRTKVIGARLNMFSDVQWEKYGVIERHPRITYYDYTKIPGRSGQVRSNYWVTLSYDGTNAEACIAALAKGHNVSAVFYDESRKAVTGRYAHQQALPNEFFGVECIDGGLTDWRPDDPRGVVVGLRLLAPSHAFRARAIESGFPTLVQL
jgi:hypothetical protein